MIPTDPFLFLTPLYNEALTVFCYNNMLITVFSRHFC